MKAKSSKTTLLHRFEGRLGWIATAAFLVMDTPALSMRRAAASPWDWTSASPESQGVSKAKLDALRESVAERKTKALLVICNDKIV